jgi:hypothetical protein
MDHNLADGRVTRWRSPGREKEYYRAYIIAAGSDWSRKKQQNMERCYEAHNFL